LNLISAKFIERVNRFVVKAKINGNITYAYLANPGRLWELLFPERELLLVENKKSKIKYVVMAVIKENLPVLLHTHYTNYLVKMLLLEKQIPWLKEYELIDEESSIGRSRIDFKLVNIFTNRKYYLEIKTCTLFGSKLAMFPDAETERGTRHIYELGEIVKRGEEAGVLYVVMSPYVEFFLPAYHIDFSFTKAFLETYEAIQHRAIAVELSPDLSTIKTFRELKIPIQFLRKEFEERGVYLLILEMKEDKIIEVGSLRKQFFKKGYYVYVGSAKRYLQKRLSRHSRQTKKKHWHIDYLLSGDAKLLKKLPIITSEDIECEVAENLKEIADGRISGFGASDCQCESHLFYFFENPIRNQAFIDVLNYFRLERPLQYICQELSQRHQNVPV